MLADEIARRGHWNIALVYYRRDRVEALDDEQGDAVIRGFLHPLVESLRRDGLLSYFNWIRYSENGFHIRCRFWAPDAATGEALRARVASSFDAFKQGTPEPFRGEATLSNAARALNEKLPGYELRRPGTLEMGPVTEAGEGSVYGTWDCYELSQVAHTHLASLCLEAVALGTPYARNLALAQVVGFDLLDSIASTRRDFSDLAAFVCETWRDFFGISAREDAPEVAHVWGRKASFHRWFDRKNTIGESLRLVPPPLHDRYLALFDWLRSARLDALRSQPQEMFAMQVLALFHQQFNRLGISIKDETAYADLLAQYGARDPEAGPDCSEPRRRVAGWVDYWSRNRVEA